MKIIRIYQCEDSVEGIFTAVYVAWAARYGHDYIKLQIKSEDGSTNYELFSEYIDVKKDSALADKVAESIRKKISVSAYQMVVRAALSDHPCKANSIYHFLVRGFAMGAKVVDHLSDKYVQDIFEMNRRVGNDSHYYKEFLRFQELENKVLLAKIEPKCNVVELITPHFADRLAAENFLILDVKRKIATVHQANNSWFLTYLSNDEVEQLLSLAESQQDYEQLWRTFFDSIAIKERENYACQRNHVALHYRKYMTEFMKKN
ncbi:MAG: TIGR03915 family putative DNA repair protein [Clostridiales bacterium]|nr:TIGR03915 family putative DNA repair protein [Clostridiales bacterium]